MDQPMRDFTDLLLRNGIVGLDQISEATNVARDLSARLRLLGDEYARRH